MKKALPVILLLAVALGCGGGGPTLPSLVGTWAFSMLDGQPVGYLPGEYFNLAFTPTTFTWSVNSPTGGYDHYTQQGNYRQTADEITFIPTLVTGTSPYGDVLPAPYAHPYSLKNQQLTLVDSGHTFLFMQVRLGTQEPIAGHSPTTERTEAERRALDALLGYYGRQR